MGEFFKRAALKVVGTVVGAMICLAWWSLTGSGESHVDRHSEMPTEVFAGGARLDIEATVNQRAVLKASFSRVLDEQTADDEEVYVEQELAVGTHHLRTSVPDNVYTYLEIGVPEAQPGAQIDWTVRVNGESAVQESETLDEPLQSGYGFFVQFEFEDIGEF